MLITEYGFALARNPYAQVDVTRVVGQLFDDAGEDGRLKKGVLHDSEYWRRIFTTHASYELY